MNTITIRDDFIKLGQALKLAGMEESGVEAKYDIEDGKVSVNGEVETRRGRKLRDGDVFSFDGQECRVSAPNGPRES
ncbi:MAG: RNA-binding S4 domain-containing protein [Eubacteriales bacterium]|nr:RNA-binding S4 domain-containing protein [Eubacteriales bacterium]